MSNGTGMPAEYAQALQPGLEALIRAARQRHARWTGAETAAAATTRASKAKEAEEENASEVRDLVPLLVQATWRLLTPLASALAPEIPTGQLRAVTPMHVLSVLGARQHANQGWHPLRQAALWGAGPIGEAEGVWGPLSLRSAVSVSSSVSLLCHPRVRLPHLSVQLQRLVAAFPFARTADVITMLRCNDSERLRLGAMVSALTEMVRAHAAATGASASSSSSDASSIGSSWKVKRDQAVARVAEAKAAAEAAAKAKKEKRKAEKGGDDDDDDEQAAGDEDEEEDAPLIVASAPPVGDLADLSCCPSLVASKEADDTLRRNFASEPPEVLRALPPMVGLRRVHEHEPSLSEEAPPMWQQPVTALGEKQLACILASRPPVAAGAEGMTVCASESIFLQRWRNFTNGLFDDAFDWTNVFAAGGSVLGCLALEGSDVSAKEVKRAGFDQTDVDLFVVGLDEVAATKKLREIVAHLRARMSPPAAAASAAASDGALGDTADNLLLSSHSVTVLGHGDWPTVQVILRCYTSPAEVLLGFDVDCCCVGFDGAEVWASDRGLRALRHRVNVVDLTRRSTTYESRLIKYAGRGFAVGIANLDLSAVDTAALGSLWRSGAAWKATGLTRLLLEHYRPKGWWRVVDPLSRAREASRARLTQRKDIAEAESLSTPLAVAEARVQRRLADGKGRGPNRWQKPELDEAGRKEVDRIAEAEITEDDQAHARETLLERSDYGWMPALGSLTPRTLAKLWASVPPEQTVLTWHMRDGRDVHLCRYEHFLREGGSDEPLPCDLRWLTRNPGRQDAAPIVGASVSASSAAAAVATISNASSSSASSSAALFTGSFQPLSAELSSWSNLADWHSAHVGSGASFPALFYLLSLARRRMMAQCVHAHFLREVSADMQAYVDSHVAELVAEFLAPEDLASFLTQQGADQQLGQKGKERTAEGSTALAATSLAPVEQTWTNGQLHARLQQSSPQSFLPPAAIPDSAFERIVQQLPSSAGVRLAPSVTRLLRALTAHVLCGVARALQQRHPGRMAPGHSDKRHDVSNINVRFALAHLLPRTEGGLLERAVSETDKVNYHIAWVPRWRLAAMRLEDDVGLVLPVKAIHRALSAAMGGHLHAAISKRASTTLAAALEYLLAEVLDLAIAESRDREQEPAPGKSGTVEAKVEVEQAAADAAGIVDTAPTVTAAAANAAVSSRRVVQAQHVLRAIRADEELRQLYAGMLLPEHLPAEAAAGEGALLTPQPREVQRAERMREHREQALLPQVQLEQGGSSSSSTPSADAAPFLALLEAAWAVDGPLAAPDEEAKAARWFAQSADKALPAQQGATVAAEDSWLRRLTAAHGLLAPVLQALLRLFFTTTRAGLDQLRRDAPSSVLGAASVLLLPRLSPFLSSGTEGSQTELVLLLPSSTPPAPTMRLAQRELEVLLARDKVSGVAAAHVADTPHSPSTTAAVATSDASGLLSAVESSSAGVTVTPVARSEVDEAQLRESGVAPLLPPAFFWQQLRSVTADAAAAVQLTPGALLVLQLYFEAAMLRVLCACASSCRSVSHAHAELLALLPSAAQRIRTAAAASLPAPLMLLDQEEEVPEEEDDEKAAGQAAPAAALAAAAAAPAAAGNYLAYRDTSSVPSPWLPWAMRRFPLLYRAQVAAGLQRFAAAKRGEDDEEGTPLLVPAFPPLPVPMPALQLSPSDGFDGAAMASGAGSAVAGFLSLPLHGQRLDPLAPLFVPVELQAHARVGRRVAGQVYPRGPRYATQLGALLLEQWAAHAQFLGLLDDEGLLLDADALRNSALALVAGPDKQWAHISLSAPGVVMVQLLIECELRRLLHTAWRMSSVDRPTRAAAVRAAWRAQFGEPF